MDRKSAFYQWASILILIAAWELLGIADDKALGFFSPMVLFAYIAAIYSAIAFIVFRNGDASKQEEVKDGK